MSFWDNEDAKSVHKTTRRDTSKFGISRSNHPTLPGRMYIPAGKANPGDRVRFIETHEGMAFKIGDQGDYRVYIQNGGTKVLLVLMPPSLNRYADKKAKSVEVEDFKGGYLIRYSQFE